MQEAHPNRLPSVPQRVILVDHRQLVREAIHALILEIENVVVSGHAADGDACLRLAEESPPDAVLCAAQLPRMSGLELAVRLKALHPALRTVIIGNCESRAWVDHAIQAGVCAVLMQRDNGIELVAALDAAREGRFHLSPIAHALHARAEPDGKASPQLTLRQREILQLYAEGFGTKEIAWRLELSVKTVSTHREQILQRLALRTNSDLIRFAIREGIVDP
jgi:DNA-binding NarL/FixJ family response regulator